MLSRMVPDSRKLLEEALRLPPEARAALAGTLIESLDEQLDEDSLNQWEQETASRLRDLAQGTVRPMPWSEARKIIGG